MKQIALLIVDVQTALVEEHPYQEEKVIENIQSLLAAARERNLEVIFVRHDDGVGSDLEKGSKGWQIYHKLRPKDEEVIFEKEYNSAFVKTGLKEALQRKNIDTLILTGMQTDYCIDATCKSAFEHGFQVIIPENTNTTFDNEFLTGERLYEYYNYKIWNQRFAKVLSLEDVLGLMKD